jgi:exosortase
MDSVSASPPAALDRVLLLVLAALFLAAFGPTIAELVTYWWTHPEYSHGFLLPPIAAWMLWARRTQVRRLDPEPSLLGALLLLPCVGLLTLGEMKLSWFLKPYALVASLGLLAWAWRGRRTLAAVALPLIVLFLACPLPGRVQNALTVPLKNTAALLATGLLDLGGYDVSLDGNVIRMPGIRDLWVADACSGVRSLLSLLTLAILACMFWRRSLALRVIVVASAVPIAVLVNGLRIWLTGLLAVHVGPDAAESFFHFFEGIALFGIAGLLLWAWAWLLSLVFQRRPA